MQNIHSIPLIKQEFCAAFNSAFKVVSDWAGYTIRWLRNLPNQMKSQPRVALAVFTIANLLFFIQINACANLLEEHVHSGPQKLDRKNRAFNNILIDLFIVGPPSLLFNFLLSQLTSYPLSKKTLAVIALVTIVMRSFFHSVED